MKSKNELVTLACNYLKTDNNLRILIDQNLGYGKDYNSVNLLYRILFEKKWLPEVELTGKSDQAAAEFRAEGNEHFRVRNYEEARISYTKAIAHAPCSSRELMLAFGNRASANKYLKNFLDTLGDYDRALELVDDDEKSESKYIFRKYEYLINAETPLPIDPSIIRRNPLEQNYTRHPYTPAAAQCLNVKMNLRFGRHISTTTDIDALKLIVTEDSYTSVLTADHFYTHCYQCLKRTLSPIPCSCVYAVFCSQNCRTLAEKGLHMYECPIMETMIKMNFSTTDRMALRVTLQSYIEHNKSWEQLQQTIQMVETTYPYDKRGYTRQANGDAVFNSTTYAAVHSLDTHPVFRGTSDCLRRAFTAAIFVHFLEKINFYKKTTGANKWFSGGLIMRNIRTVAINSIFVREFDLNNDHFNNIAMGIYPYMSLFNHSCIPHVELVCIGSKQHMVTLRPIKKGEQIFCKYGSPRTFVEYIHRPDFSLTPYAFHCRCQACYYGWPIHYEQLNNKIIPASFRRSVEKLSEKLIALAEKGDRRAATYLVGQLCTYGAEFDYFHSTKFFFDYTSKIRLCLSVLGNVVE